MRYGFGRPLAQRGLTLDDVWFAASIAGVLLWMHRDRLALTLWTLPISFLFAVGMRGGFYQVPRPRAADTALRFIFSGAILSGIVGAIVWRSGWALLCPIAFVAVAWYLACMVRGAVRIGQTVVDAYRKTQARSQR